jgi:hypothetical protein
MANKILDKITLYSLNTILNKITLYSVDVVDAVRCPNAILKKVYENSKPH